MESVNGHGRSYRYLIAIVALVAFVGIVILTNTEISFVIRNYYPSFVNYIQYVSDIKNTIFGLLGTYILYRILVSIAEMHGRKERNIGTAELVKLVLRILFYAAVISILLLIFGPYFGLSPSQALAGGAIGGIIIGLAVQTIVSNILSGFLISTSRTIVSGDQMILHSIIWGDIVCKILTVNILFTEVVNQYGHRIRLPNTVMLNSATFTKLKIGDTYTYPLAVTMSSDVSANDLVKKVEETILGEFQKRKQRPPEIYLSAKASGANTFTVLLNFSALGEIIVLTDIVNRAFDDAYWRLKNLPRSSKQHSL